MADDEFKRNFGELGVPAELARLLDFQMGVGADEFSQGFFLRSDDKEGLRLGWSKDPEFLGKLLPFARANYSGSFYALWLVNEDANLSSQPVVVFGDEGGEHVIANNLRDLLQLLTYDCEPLVSEAGIIFADRADDDDDDDDDEEDEDDDDLDAEDLDEDGGIISFEDAPHRNGDETELYWEEQADYGEPSPAIDRYREWLREQFNLEPIGDPYPIVARAQDNYKSAFDAWKAKFLDS